MVTDPNIAEVNSIVISLVIRYRMILINANSAATYTMMRLSKSLAMTNRLELVFIFDGSSCKKLSLLAEK